MEIGFVCTVTPSLVELRSGKGEVLRRSHVSGPVALRCSAGLTTSLPCPNPAKAPESNRSAPASRLAS